uniref:F-box domain-containing protein n=1 Tax=Acrobeloides nanus TaxID=290746 RepID=A0A914E5Z0_9BILA
MSSLTQFTLWTKLPSELKNEVIRRIDPKNVLKFAQASKDSLKRVDFLLETKQVRKIVVNTLCVKSGNTDQVYLECVQHDKEHAHEELKMMTCLCCIGSCVHYQNEFEQHCRRVKLGNCKTKFTQVSVESLPRVLKLFDVLDTISYVNMKYSLVPTFELMNDSFVLLNEANYKAHKITMLDHFHDFNYKEKPLLKPSWEIFHYEEIKFDLEMELKIFYRLSLYVFSFIDIKSRIFDDLSCLVVPAHEQIKPNVDEDEITFKSPNLYGDCTYIIS